MVKIRTTHLRGVGDLGEVQDIAAFRALVETSGLSPDDRRTLVDQALLLVDQIYVHLMHKRARYAVNPAQRLRLLRFHAPRMSVAQFHAELLRIFVELRDLHTNYILPMPYRGQVAFLGVMVEQYWEGGTRHWMVSKVYENLTGDRDLREGCEIVHWNGAPMELAVARNAEREAGSNPPARTARGLERMTLRKLALSPPPDEDWVDLTYRDGDRLREVRLDWRVYEPDELEAVAPGVDGPTAEMIAMDLRTDLVRLAKKRLFAPGARREQDRVDAIGAAVPEPTPAQLEAGEIPTTRRDELRARRVPTPDGDYGHLRIYTFHMQDGDIVAFVREVRRLLEELPDKGLILDVRGNGGGYLLAAEYLLQFFTDREIEPEPMQLINSDGTADLCTNVAGLERWLGSITDAIQTGAQYSSAFPLYDAETVNEVGRVYPGPVVLVTDALCYSATDIFAAGFQDHEIGRVLGVDENTGGGGANVWTDALLRERWPEGPYEPLPVGAQLRVALRRSLRVGPRAGEPVEDVGVVPYEIHQMTRRDLLEDNADLIAHAIRLLG